MDEQFLGGAANTPPFPRLVPTDVPNLGGAPIDVPRPGAAAVPHGPGPHPTRDAPLAAIGRPEQPPAPIGFASATAGGDDDEAEPTRRFRQRAGDEVRRRAAGGINRGFERFADRLEGAAERIERIAEDRLHGPGGKARAGDMAHSTANWIDDFANYLRSSELETMKADLERIVRERPVQSLVVAAGAGWLLGKIMR